jgi:DNA invertase Pin-like site-specific DNA recombinase
MVCAKVEFVRHVILKRQREGIALAKEKGKYKGRKAKEIPNFDDYYERYMRREITKAEIQRENHVSRTVVDRYFRNHIKNI